MIGSTRLHKHPSPRCADTSGHAAESTRLLVQVGGPADGLMVSARGPI
jgi:hypothetical protein